MNKFLKRKWVIGCSLVVVLLLGLFGFAVLQVVDYPVVALRADKVAAEYRAAGLPWVAEDLDAQYVGKTTIPDALKSDLAKRDGPWSVVDENLTNLIEAQDYNGVKSLIDGLVSPSVDEFKAIAAADVFFIDYDWDLGASVLFPEFARVKTGVKVLAARSEMKAREGDLTGALDDLRAGYSISNKVGNTPTLIGMLVGIACRILTLQGAMRVADLRRDNAQWLAQCRSEIAGWSPEADLIAALQGDSYMGIAVIRNLPTGTAAIPDRDGGGIPFMSPEGLIRDGMPEDTIRRAFMVRHLEMHIQLVRMSEEFGGDPRKVSKAWDQLEEDTNGQGLKMSLALNKILVPLLTKAGDAIVRDRFLRESAMAVLWAQELKAQTGSYPTDLKGYPGGLVDSFTGLPAQYKIFNDRVEVFSLGSDGVLDDKRVGEFGDPDDFGWVLPALNGSVRYSRKH